MTFSQLQAFVTVVETRSFTKSGERLTMTQSAVSHAVAVLESELGVQLIVRDRKHGVMPSGFGQRVLEPAPDILGRVAQIEQEAAAEQGLEAGVVRIGSFPSAAARLLPKMIAAWESLHPKITLVLFEGSDHEVLEWLQSRVIDAAFVAQAEGDSHMIPLTRDKMVAVMPQGHALGKGSAVSVPRLADSPFIMSRGGCEPLIREIFHRAGVGPRIRFEVQDMATILNMVKEGVGITVVPELALPDVLTGIEIRDLNPPFWRQVGLRSLFESDMPRAVRMFLDSGKFLLGLKSIPRAVRRIEGGGRADDGFG